MLRYLIPSKQQTKNETAVYTPRQTIGATVDRTEAFRIKREEKRKMLEDRTKSTLDHLSKCFKTPPSNNTTYSVSNLFGKLTLTDKSVQCPLCNVAFGFFGKKNECRLCLATVCSNCIISLTEEHVKTLIPPKQVVSVCNRCFIVATRETKHNQYSDIMTAVIEAYQPFSQFYETLKYQKQQILELAAKYEYLTHSLDNKNTPKTKSITPNDHIYESITKLERELMTRFHTIQLNLKKLSAFPDPRVPASVSTKRFAMVKQSIHQDIIQCLQIHLPKYKMMKEEVKMMELKTISGLYQTLYRLCMESLNNSSFWNKFSKLFMATMKQIQGELYSAVINSGGKWEQYKKEIDDKIKNWEKHSAPLLTKNSGKMVEEIENEFEGSLIRKNVKVLRDSLKELQSKLGSTENMDADTGVFLAMNAINQLINELQASYDQEAMAFAQKELFGSEATIKSKDELKEKEQRKILHRQQQQQLEQFMSQSPPKIASSMISSDDEDFKLL